jgi:predicted nuclease of predicted toxin-antitoxin system
VKLLFDQNLSPALAESIADLYPGSTHVMLVGLDRSSDTEVWEYAKVHEFILVSKDSDFIDLCVMVGGPARLIWVRLGNCPTQAVASAFRDEHENIKALLPHNTILVLPVQ